MPEPDTTPASVVHACPPRGSGLTPCCCRRPPFELSRADRMTTDPDAVTCASPWRILGANPDQPYRHDAPETEHPNPQATVARIQAWIAGEPVAGRSEFGNGYREALRDITDPLNGPPAPGDHGGEGP